MMVESESAGDASGAMGWKGSFASDETRRRREEAAPSEHQFYARTLAVARQDGWPENRARGRTMSVPFVAAEPQRAEEECSRRAEETKSEESAARRRSQTPVWGNADRSSSRESTGRRGISWAAQAPGPEPRCWRQTASAGRSSPIRAAGCMAPRPVEAEKAH